MAFPQNIVKDRRESGQKLSSLVAQLIDRFAKENPATYFEKNNRENISIYLPLYAIALIKEYYESNFRDDEKKEEVLYLYGHKVVVGYENKLIVAHRDAPLYPNLVVLLDL